MVALVAGVSSDSEEARLRVERFPTPTGVNLIVYEALAIPLGGMYTARMTDRLTHHEIGFPTPSDEVGTP
jgi:hypothetical protein